MGYNALGIVFGPLLVGEMLGSHAVKLADPSSGLFIVPVSPSPKSKKDKKRAKESTDEPQQVFLDVDKIHIANDITEMLITNWRDVVRQMRNLEGDMSIFRRRSLASNSIDEPRLASSSLQEGGTPTKKRKSDKHILYDRPVSPTASSSSELPYIPPTLSVSNQTS